MTNQSQPLTLTLSNGREVSIADTKCVLRLTENGQQRSCAIVRGPEGAAIYNADGDVEINGAPCSAHWLQPGDKLQFSDRLSATVDRLGVANQALNSLLDDTRPATQAYEVPTEVPVASQLAPALTIVDQDTFTPATAAASYTPETQIAQAPEAPASVAPASADPVLVDPVSADPVSPDPVLADPISITPAEAIESTDPAAGFVIPAALAALGVAAVSAEPADEQVVPPAEMTDFSLLDSAIAEPEVKEPAETLPPMTGFAAELLASIQAEANNEQQHENENENENETVGTSASETTHSPLATDGLSLSSPDPTPAAELNSISSLIPELPTTSAENDQEEYQPEFQPESLESQTSSQVETTTFESTERQTQSSNVSALLERMKAEGQWGGLSDEAAEEASPVENPETQEPPVVDEADEDVQSYMSQLLSRMRNPDDEHRQPVVAAAAAPAPAEVQPEVVEAPKPVGLLKPEEYVPKTKARRLDSLQDMRALANTQTRTAIDRSQAKRLETSMGNINLTIAVASCVVAAIAMASNFFGYLTFATAGAVAVIAMICGAFYCCKTYCAELLESKKKDAAAPLETPEPSHEAV